MKILEILQERRIQRTTYMYHGTSSVFLDSILTNGLLPNPGHKSWVGFQDLPSLGGVYISADENTAIEAAEAAAEIHGGEPIIITISVVTASGTPDEDDVIDRVLKRSYEISKGQYKSIIAPEYEIVKSFKQNFKISDVTIHVIKQIISTAVKILQQEKWDGFVYDLLADLRKDSRIEPLIVKLLKTMRPRIGYATNVRITRPIKFKGKTRIIRIEDLKSHKILYSQQHKMVP